MANKRVIDLSTLSETVQEGQYVLVDSSGGTGKMDLKKIVDDSTETLADQVEQNTQDIENLSGDLETLEGRVDDAEEAITGKADDDGIYPELYAGNLISDKMQEDKTPYLFRKTAGNLSRVGERCYDTLIGASVGENQLVNIKASGGSGGVSFTFNSTTGEISFSGTATSSYMGDLQSANANIIGNHIYLLKPTVVANPNSISFGIGYLNVSCGTVNINSAKIIKPSTDRSSSVGIDNYSAGTVFDGVKVKFNTIDLTALLGFSIADYIYSLETATAGAGIAKLRSWGFLRGYQAYNAGSLESVEVTGKVVRGFNQWNEEWEVGVIDSNTGENVNSSSQIRSKNFIPVKPRMQLYIKSPNQGSSSVGNLAGRYYDSNKQYLGNNPSMQVGSVITVPQNCFYIRFGCQATYGTTYNHDICINLSSSRNGEYEPYVSHTYDLGSDVLRGIFKLDANNNLYADGDVKTSDGTITRRYSELLVDGSFNVRQVNLHSTTGLYYTIITNTLNAPVSNPIPLSNRFIGVPSGIAVGNCYVTNNGASLVTVLPDQSITTVDGATQWFAQNPTKFIYELATPTTEQGDPFPSPQVCYPDGTEEFITESDVPVGHETSYLYDLNGLVEGLIDVPDVPSANGTYVLKATRSASGVAYNWVTG